MRLLFSAMSVHPHARETSRASEYILVTFYNGDI